MCSLTGSRTWDLRNTVLHLNRQLSSRSHTFSHNKWTLLNRDTPWTVTLPCYIEIHHSIYRVTEHCNLNSELYQVPVLRWASIVTGWKKMCSLAGTRTLNPSEYRTAALPTELSGCLHYIPPKKLIVLNRDMWLLQVAKTWKSVRMRNIYFLFCRIFYLLSVFCEWALQPRQHK
jgi:hypothetical protein